MKRLLVILLLISATVNVNSLTVYVEQILDAPQDWNGQSTFLGDRLLFLRNGDLLISDTNASNLFTLIEGKWEPLIEAYHLDDYNKLQERKMGSRGNILIFDSCIPGEYFLSIRARPLPAEYYRIYVNERGEAKTELVDERYYKSHQKVYASPPKLEEETTHELSLNKGYILELKPDDERGMMFSVKIKDKKGNVVYQVDEYFLNGRMQTIGYAAVNPAMDKIALIITYCPTEGSSYIDRLVILKLNYD